MKKAEFARIAKALYSAGFGNCYTQALEMVDTVLAAMPKSRDTKRVVLGTGDIYTGAFCDGREVSLENPARTWEGARKLKFPRSLSGKRVRLVAEVLPEKANRPARRGAKTGGGRR